MLAGTQTKRNWTRQGTLITIKAPLEIKKISAAGCNTEGSKIQGSKLKSHNRKTLSTKYAIKYWILTPNNIDLNIKIIGASAV